MGAFAVFFMQSASFLAYERDMQRTQGHNNAQSLFGIDQVPSDPHIRNLLDRIAPEHFAAPFWRVFEHLCDGDYLPGYQGHFGGWLLAVDGTDYFSSQKIHCPQCTVRVVNERTYYSHTLVAPLLVAPEETRVIALELEFVRRRMAARNKIVNCASEALARPQYCALRVGDRHAARRRSLLPPTFLRASTGGRLALYLHLQTGFPSRAVSGSRLVDESRRRR